MPEHALRFGVAAPSGLRAESWKCWTQSGTGKSDVYVSCRALGSSLKLSLHESGRWHVGFDSNRFAEMFETESAPADRFAGKFDCPAPLIEDLTLACRISVPWHAATISGPIKDKGIHWVDPAPRGQAVEFNVFLLKRPPDATDWPGKDAMRTGLVGHLPLGDNGSVCVVYRVCAAIQQPSPQISPPRYFKGKTEADLLSDGNRALMWGMHTDGSVLFQESSIVVSKVPDA